MGPLKLESGMMVRFADCDVPGLATMLTGLTVSASGKVTVRVCGSAMLTAKRPVGR